MEDAILYIPADIAYFVKLNSVVIETYTDTIYEPNYSTIIIEEDDFIETSPKSKFVLLSDLTSNVGNLVAEPSLAAAEASELSQSNMGFHVAGTNFEMKRFNIESRINNSNFDIFNPIYLETKSFTLTDITTSGYGGIIFSDSPLNLYVTNMIVDYSLKSHGFSLDIACEYSGATTVNELVFENLIAKNSQTKVDGVTGPFMSILGASNISITNSNIEVYEINSEGFAPVVLRTSAECNPADTVKQILDVSNVTFIVNDNTQAAQINVAIDETHARATQLTIQDIIVNTNIADPLHPLISISTNEKVQNTIRNVVFDTKKFRSSVFVFQNSPLITFENVLFQDINTFGESLMSIRDVTTMNINNITIDSCNDVTTGSSYYIYYNSGPGKLIIDGLAMQNLNGGARIPIQLVSATYLKITSSVMTNIATTSAVISTPNMKTFDVDGLNFITVTGSILFDLTGFDLEGSETLSLSNIIATNTTTPALNIERVSNHNGTAASFTISNFQYLDSTFGQFDTPTTLFTFTKLQHDFDFDIFIND